MSNAIRYTEAGSVMMGCRRRGNKVSIEVWDTGCGISEDQMPNIFEDFYQIENKERDRSKGLGLGLALAKRLSLSLNHTIECKSTLGSGSCFSVLVEIGEVKNSEVQLEAISNIMDLTGARILLVEDDIDVLKASIQLMESWGCIVDAGRDLDEIKNIIRSPGYLLPNIIVADNRLPGDASGVDVVKLVQQELESLIPSIIITGDVERSHIQSIKEKGLPVLLKPIQPAKFRAILSHLINS
jgi:CheY-like chemotaxis protein